MNLSTLPRVLLLLWAGLPGALFAADWQSLLGNSPFGSTVAASTGETGDLEFRGVVQEEGIYFVNLYNPVTKTAQWIAVSGTAPGLEVKSYDAISDKVQIMQAGRALTLPMKQAHVSLVSVALVAAAPAPTGAKGANSDSGNGENLEDRRAQVRNMIRARLENSPNGEPSPLMRNLPPEAQAMIEEYRRRRAGNSAAPGEPGPSPSQAQGQEPRPRRDRQP